jgi:hypothetical protein
VCCFGLTSSFPANVWAINQFYQNGPADLDIQEIGYDRSRRAPHVHKREDLWITTGELRCDTSSGNR